MPNGADKNLFRLLEVVNGFRAEFGAWPTQVRMPSACIEDLRDNVLTHEGWMSLRARMSVLEDEGALVAEDALGRQYVYLSGDHPETALSEEWLDLWEHVRHGI